MLCVPTPPMFAYCSGTFRNGDQPFCRLPCKMAALELTAMLFLYIIQAAAFCIPDIFLASRFRKLQ